MSSFLLYRNEIDQNPIKVNIQQQDQQKILYNYTQLKKLVLTQLNYPVSNKNSIQLSFLGVYPKLPNLKTPIVNDQNLKFLLKTIYQNYSQVKILLTPIKALKQKSQRKRNNKVIEFDSDGSVQSFDEQKFADIIPEKGRYTGSQLIRCSFCQKSNKDTHQIKSLGPLYGPYGKQYYVHIICAIWVSEIYLTQDGDQLLKVQNAVEKALTSKCKICKRSGAQIICHSSLCKGFYHYKCAQNEQFQFNWLKYTCLCKKCKLNKNSRKKLSWDIELKQESTNNNKKQDTMIIQ